MKRHTKQQAVKERVARELSAEKGGNPVKARKVRRLLVGAGFNPCSSRGASVDPGFTVTPSSTGEYVTVDYLASFGDRPSMVIEAQDMIAKYKRALEEVGLRVEIHEQNIIGLPYLRVFGLESL